MEIAYTIMKRNERDSMVKPLMLAACIITCYNCCTDARHCMQDLTADDASEDISN